MPMAERRRSLLLYRPAALRPAKGVVSFAFGKRCALPKRKNEKVSMMNEHERAELIRAIVAELAAEVDLRPEQFLRRLFFRALERNPGWTILPGFGGVDRHGARGLNQQPVDPAWF